MEYPLRVELVLYNIVLYLCYYHVFLVIKPRDPSKVPATVTHRPEDTCVRKMGTNFDTYGVLGVLTDGPF